MSITDPRVQWPSKVEMSGRVYEWVNEPYLKLARSATQCDGGIETAIHCQLVATHSKYVWGSSVLQSLAPQGYFCRGNTLPNRRRTGWLFNGTIYCKLTRSTKFGTWPKDRKRNHGSASRCDRQPIIRETAPDLQLQQSPGDRMHSAVAFELFREASTNFPAPPKGLVSDRGIHLYSDI